MVDKTVKFSTPSVILLIPLNKLHIQVFLKEDPKTNNLNQNCGVAYIGPLCINSRRMGYRVAALKETQIDSISRSILLDTIVNLGVTVRQSHLFRLPVMR